MKIYKAKSNHKNKPYLKLTSKETKCKIYQMKKLVMFYNYKKNYKIMKLRIIYLNKIKLTLIVIIKFNR